MRAIVNHNPAEVYIKHQLNDQTFISNIAFVMHNMRWLNDHWSTCSSNTVFNENVWPFSRGLKDGLILNGFFFWCAASNLVGLINEGAVRSLCAKRHLSLVWITKGRLSWGLKWPQRYLFFVSIAENSCQYRWLRKTF